MPVERHGVVPLSWRRAISSGMRDVPLVRRCRKPDGFVVVLRASFDTFVLAQRYSMHQQSRRTNRIAEPIEVRPDFRLFADMLFE